MRIIAGTHKGRILYGPKSHGIRPAIDKVKGAIFNILFDVSCKKVLDLFAGTGSVGLEALSRGASSAVFVDDGSEALRLIRKNIEACHFEGKSTIVKYRLPRGLAKPLQRFAPFDLIFVDPPYDKDLVNSTLREISEAKFLSPEGTIVVEHSPRETIEEISELRVVDQRKYGQTYISFLRNNPDHTIFFATSSQRIRQPYIKREYL